MNLQLRPVQDADELFLRRLHREAMGPHVEATWGSWNPDAQAERFAKAPISEHTLILLDGQPIGCLLVLQGADAVVLSRIWLLPEAQNRGIGTHLILQVCGQAAERGQAVRLRVLKANRAHRLYARLGFTIVEDGPTHFVMERPAVVASGSDTVAG